MIAYKWLRAGGIGPFSRQQWPLPAGRQPGGWLEAVPDHCASGIHACTRDQLAPWMSDELWEIELDGDVQRDGGKLVAGRGRLLAPVAAWDDATRSAYAAACIERLADRVARDGSLTGYADDARMAADAGMPPVVIAGIAAHAAEVEGGGAERAAERRWQARWLAERLALHAG